MNVVPYVIRDELGYWHSYPLQTWDGPVSMTLIVCLQPGESLDCQTVINALQPALQPAPVGDWYKWPIAGGIRNIRKDHTTTADLVYGLLTGDQVQVSQIITAPPGTWGCVRAYKHGATITPCDGWVYMNQMVKV